ncbi:MAG: FG-GAP-like repeat-containing protein [Terriglobia bacterium]|nr:FG-GAP-like repeat-containing protein [Terriglobia bacterium]
MQTRRPFRFCLVLGGRKKASPQNPAPAALACATAVLSRRLTAFKTFTAFCLLNLLFVFSAGAASAASPVMNIPGQASVSAAGTFDYSIPIAVPPGTAGMAPKLSLDYSSAATDGFEGWGFSLDGLASITRCARTITLDSVHGSVNYDMNDRFCLDGQRLMLATGTYGADGSTYKTYIDSFSKIIAHGSAGNGPAWFEIHTKSGTVLQVGNTADSAIQAVGKTTNREWLVNQVTDTKGNYYKVTYTDDQTNGQAYPTRIDYTGNATAGLATYNSVQFTYAARADIVPAYQAGSLQQMTVVLTDIKTYAGAMLVTDYKLAYRAGTSTLHSRVTSVTRCDSTGTTCLAPTTFGWQGGVALTSMSGTANSTAQGFGLMAGDFNADGLTDAVVLDPSCPTGGVIFSGSNAGTFTRANMTANYTYWLTGPPPSEVPYSGPACFKGSPLFGDLNGDGFADAMQNLQYWITGVDPHWGQFVGPLLNTKTGALNQQGSVDTTIPRMIILGDFNGDGRIDGYGAAPHRQFYYSNGDGTFTTGGTTGLSGTLFGGDFDGDGCEDLMQQGSPNQLYYGCYPAVATATVPDLTNKTVIVGDFNGDLSTDVLVVDSIGAVNAVLYLATGTGLDGGHTISSSTGWHNYQIVEGDWNGDGKADIALISSTTSSHLIFVSTGTGFAQIATIASTATSTSAVSADWNNDGVSDLWIQKSAGDKLYTSLFGSASYAPERVISVSNGIGATTTVAYDRLNKNGTFFTRSTGAAYPYQDADGPSYVVSSFSVSNGVGGTYATNYAYAGLRTNVTDPPKQNTLPTGFLSFGSVTSTDAQTGIVTTTNYRTDIPYVGLIASQTVKSGSTTLKSVANTWNAASETGGAFIMTLTQSVLTQKDLDGTVLPTITTSFPSYDSYANPLTITQSVSDGSSQTTTNTFTNDTTNWILGQLTSSNVQRIVGTSNLTRHLSVSHDPTSGLVTQEIVEPSATNNQYLKSVYGYDAFGNRTSVTTSSYTNAYGAARTTSLVYDNKGQFVVTATNALSHSETWGTVAAPAYDARFGLPTSHTDLNGLVTSWSYDTFGRVALETRPDGNKTAWTYTLLSSSIYPNIAFYSDAIPRASDGVTQNGPYVRGYYDSLSRKVIAATQGFGGAWIFAYTQYDAWGRVGGQSRPYFYTSGQTQPQASAKFTVYTYDILARVTKATFPDTSDTATAYHGLSSTVTNDKSQATTTVLNAQGLAASVTDANSKVTSYVYDAFGGLTTVTDPLSNVVTNTFDIRGRKTASHDPDMGSWSYGYDAFAELTSQTDAKSQNTTLTYDLLGRPCVFRKDGTVASLIGGQRFR